VTGQTEADKNDAGDRHDNLLADDGVPEGQYVIAGDHVSRHPDTVAMDYRIQILRIFHTNLSSLYIGPQGRPKDFVDGPGYGQLRSFQKIMASAP
jgi:hypothetical protein